MHENVYFKINSEYNREKCIREDSLCHGFTEFMCFKHFIDFKKCYEKSLPSEKTLLWIEIMGNVLEQ